MKSETLDSLSLITVYIALAFGLGSLAVTVLDKLKVSVDDITTSFLYVGVFFFAISTIARVIWHKKLSKESK